MKWGACLLIVVATVGCKKESPAVTKAAEPQPHPESLTDWTTKTELFMEYPPLVAGQTSRFAVHLTRLDNFKPVILEGTLDLDRMGVMSLDQVAVIAVHRSNHVGERSDHAGGQTTIKTGRPLGEFKSKIGQLGARASGVANH